MIRKIKIEVTDISTHLILELKQYKNVNIANIAQLWEISIVVDLHMEVCKVLFCWRRK